MRRLSVTEIRELALKTYSQMSTISTITHGDMRVLVVLIEKIIELKSLPENIARE